MESAGWIPPVCAWPKCTLSVISRAGCTHRRVPDVNTFVEGAAGQEPAVRTEGHAVDGLLVFGERVNADASIHVPQSHRRVERGTEEQRGIARLNTHTSDTERVLVCLDQGLSIL